MPETERPRSTLRSIGAVVAGLLFIFVVTTIIDVVMHATGVFSPWGKPMSDALFGLATAYRIVVSMTGCWIAARLAPDRPMGHALALGVSALSSARSAPQSLGTRGPTSGRTGIRCSSS